VARKFRVGITPDFDRSAKGLLDPFWAQCFDPVPGLTYGRLRDVGRTATPGQIADVDAVYNLALAFTAQSFSGRDRLAVIARWGVGYDMIDVEACTANDVALCITPDGVRRPVAEAELTMLLALTKCLLPKDRHTRAGKWRDPLPPTGICLAGRVLGSIGLGNIGSELMRLVQPFGLKRRLAADPYIDPAVAPALGVELVDLGTLLRESDFVMVNCWLSKETYHLIGRRELALMKPTAFLVNCARGAIVDGAALAEVLAARRIAGAGVDVFEQEPPDPADPLLRLDNVIVAPHGIAWTEEIIRGSGLGACAAILAVARGEAPEHVVNRAVLGRPGFQAKLARYRAS
jgi:phosphoglycerate dehydrogenase-like enzyme